MQSVAFSPDGRQIVSGSEDKTVKLWDASTGRLLRTFEGHTYWVESVAFSPDGRQVLSGGARGTVMLWDAATGRVVRTFKGHTDIVYSVAFSRDGRQVLSGGSDKTLKLWDVATGKVVRTFEDNAGSVFSVAFSPDGRQVLSSGDDKTVRLWDAATGQVVGREGNPRVVYSVAFSPDGRLALLGSGDRTLKLWNAAAGKVVRIFAGHSQLVRSVAFSPDGRQVLSGSNDKTVRLWDVATGKAVRTFEGHSDGVISVAFSPDGRLVLSGGSDRSVKMWDAATGKAVRTFEGHSDGVASVAFSPDGRQVLSGSNDKAVRLWDVTAGKLVQTFGGHSDGVASVAFSPDGRQVLSGSDDKTVRLWDVATGKAVRIFDGHTNWVYSVAFSPDGRQVLSGSADKTVRLWDAATGQVVRTFEGHAEFSWHDMIWSVAFSPDGRQVLSGANDANAKLWDAATGQVVRTLNGRSTDIQSVAFSPDGRSLLGASHMILLLWDVQTAQVVRTFEGHSDQVVSVAFSPDGRKVLSGGWDKTVKLWDAATGKLIRTFEGHSSAVRSVAFSPDGRQVLSGGWDTTTRVWKTATGELLATLIAARDGEWLAIVPEGFFNVSSPRAATLLSIVRAVDAYSVDQLWQSLYSPDLVREKLAGDPDGEVAKAAAVTNLEKVLDSGKPPNLLITSPEPGARSAEEIITAKATITEQDSGGIGRIEWRVNGITVGVSNPAPGSGPKLSVTQTLALDPGENDIEVVAYNGPNLLASVPVETKVTWSGTVTAKPNLHVLAIGINKYIDKGGVAPGESKARRFPPLRLAVPDAKGLSAELKRAGQGLYGEVHVRAVLDEEATSDNLDAVVTEVAAEIEPRDTFVLYAAAHGYSRQGRFYLIPQDYQGGPEPQALAVRAIDQPKLQDWIATRIKAKKVLILLDTCESGALTSGYTRSRFDSSQSDAAIGRLHEATGRPVLTAAGLGQSALELTELGHGVFTSAVIDSLYRGDTNGDGVVSLSELVSHVEDLVPRLIKDPKARAEVIRRGPAGGAQSARFGGRGEDFGFVRRLQ